MPTVAPETCRLFFALWPGDDVRAGIQAAADEWQWPATCVRVTCADLHVTLHFLGNVARESVAALSTLQVDFTPFVLSLGRAEQWRHGLAVLRPTSMPSALIDLHRTLADRIVDIGLAVDAREYRPHVTLARKAGTAVPPPSPAVLSWYVDRYALVQSQARGANRYSVVAEFPAR